MYQINKHPYFEEKAILFTYVSMIPIQKPPKKNVHFPSSPNLCQVIPGDTIVEPDSSYILYQALYEYNSTDPDDLKFKQNDIIRVTDEGL